MMFPVEFIVTGTPVSHQGSSRGLAAWKERVRVAAQTRIRDTSEWAWLDDRPVSVTILYFLPTPMTGDVDNIVKPILDGMTGAVFPDDRVVERVLIQRFEPGYDWVITPRTEQLFGALAEAPPVVYIRVDDDLGWRRFQ